MNDHQQLFLRNLLAYAVQRNVALDALCRHCGIDEQTIRAGREVPVSATQLNDLWLQISHLTNDPMVGLHVGESLQLAALGVVGELVKSSQTIGEAVTHAAAFIPLVTDLFRVQVTQTAQTCSITFIPEVEAGPDLSFMQRQLADLFMAFTIHEVDGLILAKVKPMAVSLPYTAAGEPEYQRVLRCSQLHHEAIYSLTFAPTFWQVPILTGNYELQSQLLKKAGKMVQDLGQRQPLRERVASYLLANAYLGIPSVEDIAANFNTSTRSLQRNLQEEGVSYQQLADSVRKTLALHYIQVGSHPIKEISYMLGYNELSAFTRAFKRWTGTSPVTYRSMS